MKLTDTPLTDRPPIRNRYEFDCAINEAYRRWRESGEDEVILSADVADIHRRLDGYNYDSVDEKSVDEAYIRHEIFLEGIINAMSSFVTVLP